MVDQGKEERREKGDRTRYIGLLRTQWTGGGATMLPRGKLRAKEKKQQDERRKIEAARAKLNRDFYTSKGGEQRLLRPRGRKRHNVKEGQGEKQERRSSTKEKRGERRGRLQSDLRGEIRSLSITERRAETRGGKGGWKGEGKSRSQVLFLTESLSGEFRKRQEGEEKVKWVYVGMCTDARM